MEEGHDGEEHILVRMDVFWAEDDVVRVPCEDGTTGRTVRDIKVYVREVEASVANVPIQELVVSWQRQGEALDRTLITRKGDLAHLRRARVALPGRRDAVVQ